MPEKSNTAVPCSQSNGKEIRNLYYSCNTSHKNRIQLLYLTDRTYYIIIIVLDFRGVVYHACTPCRLSSNTPLYRVPSLCISSIRKQKELFLTPTVYILLNATMNHLVTNFNLESYDGTIVQLVLRVKNAVSHPCLKDG